MNPILETKLQELEKAGDYECWYLVKQPTSFDSLCYLVSFLKEYKSKEISGNLQDFIGKKILEITATKPSVEISNNYRALRVAAFFGLIIMTSNKYDEARITDTFEEITGRCNGEYEKTELYADIIQRQIEKMFISSEIDEASKGVRNAYRLYPVMLLYKVLLELGRSTGNYSISMTEYRYLVATTKVFEDFLETLLLIKLLREDKDVEAEFEKYKTKFDNRLIQALKQLDTLNIDRDIISLKSEKKEEAAKKVFLFEENPNIFTTENYIDFLGSTKSLFEVNQSESENVQSDNLENNRLTNGKNVLLYGVPGVGKSHKIATEYCNDEKYMERVVFHPDYTYSDFVGQILPTLNEKTQKLEYAFVKGPFTKIVGKAVDDPEHNYYLVIEGINRGNAPAIFGDIFQLLDRYTKDSSELTKHPEFLGQSEYGITNFDIAREVYGNKDKLVKIPSNLFILATMNTADQNVFTLDTAFQRRWELEHIENDIDSAEHTHEFICGSSISWGVFVSVVNEQIVDGGGMLGNSGDKRLGAYFARLSEIRDKKKFSEKVLKYLWDDAFRMEHDKMFASKYNTADSMIEDFEKNDGNTSLEKVLNKNVYQKMIEKMKTYSEVVDNTAVSEPMDNESQNMGEEE